MYEVLNRLYQSPETWIAFFLSAVIRLGEHIVKKNYCQISNVRRIFLVGNTIGDHSDVVGASSVGAAPTTSSFSI